MLKIPIEIHPFGDGDKRRTLGNITIINDGTHKNRPEYGNYKIMVNVYDEIKEYEFKIKNHKRDEGWIKLLHKATGELLEIAKKSKNKELQDS